MKRRVLALLLAAAGVSCASLAESNARSFGALKRQAAFDLTCSEAELTTTNLSPCPETECHVSKIGVVGCGRKATYRVVQTRQDALTWTMDSKSEYPPQSQQAK